MRVLLFSFLLLCHCLFIPVSPSAAADLDSVIRDISKDFRPILGHLVAAQKAVYIDVGSKEGVRSGDMFSVFVTQGQIEMGQKKKPSKRSYAGTILVEKVEETRSICTVLKRVRPLPNGSEVERFSGLRATILGLDSNLPPELMQLKMRLKKELWWFEWVDDEALPTSFDSMEDLSRYRLDIAFVISTSGVRVYRAPKVLMGNYPMQVSSTTSGQRLSKPETPYWDIHSLSKVAELPSVAKQVVVKDCNGDGTLEVYTIVDNELFFDKWGDNAPKLLRTYSEPYWETLSLSISCELGLMAINSIERGVGLHSSLVALGSGDIAGHKDVATDVNLWLIFSPLDGLREEAEVRLLGEEPYTSKGARVKKIYLLRPAPSGGLVYLDEMSVPRGFSLKDGYLMGNYLFFRDEGGRWVVAYLAENKLVWRKELDTHKLKKAVPLFTISVPFNTKSSKNGLLVPVYFPENKTSRLYLIDPNAMELIAVSEPVAGQMIGLDLVGGRLYLALQEKEKAQTIIFAISID